MGGHVFLDHMPFKITCVMIAYVLKEVYIYIYICLSQLEVEQLASLTTQAAKDDRCCAGLTWPASSLIDGLLQSISSLIGVIA